MRMPLTQLSTLDRSVFELYLAPAPDRGRKRCVRVPEPQRHPRAVQFDALSPLLSEHAKARCLPSSEGMGHGSKQVFGWE